MPGRMMTEEFELEERAKKWIAAIKSEYRTHAAQRMPPAMAARIAEVGNFKML